MSLEELRALMTLLAERVQKADLRTHAHLLRLSARMEALEAAVIHLTPEPDRKPVEQAIQQREQDLLRTKLVNLKDEQLSAQLAEQLQNWQPTQPLFPTDESSLH